MTAAVATATDTVTTDNTSADKRDLSLAQRLALGTRLTELREAACFSQLEVARKALGFTVSHAAVSRLERGVFGVVDNAKLDKLAEFYGSSVDALLAEMEGRQEDAAPEEFRSTDTLVVQPGVDRRLFNLRQASGLTRMQMAEALGHTSVSVWSSWEKGQATPRPDTLLDMAITMKVSAAWLITGKRARPEAPTLPLRLRAMQKVYDLSNRELALLADMDLESGPPKIARMSRRAVGHSEAIVHSVAQALDVPVSWICPPEGGFEPVATEPVANPLPEGLTPTATKFIGELADLFASKVLSDKDVSKLRGEFMRSLIAAHMPVRKNSPKRLSLQCTAGADGAVTPVAVQ